MKIGDESLNQAWFLEKLGCQVQSQHDAWMCANKKRIGATKEVRLKQKHAGPGERGRWDASNAVDITIMGHLWQEQRTHIQQKYTRIPIFFTESTVWLNSNLLVGRIEYNPRFGHKRTFKVEWNWTLNWKVHPDLSAKKSPFSGCFLNRLSEH